MKKWRNEEIKKAKRYMKWLTELRYSIPQGQKDSVEITKYDVMPKRKDGQFGGR